ncbi:MAG: hypothetical protein WBB26_05875 [Saprospiraceae bacterium]
MKNNLGFVPTGHENIFIILYRYSVPTEQESGVELFLQFLPIGTSYC